MVMWLEEKCDTHSLTHTPLPSPCCLQWRSNVRMKRRMWAMTAIVRFLRKMQGRFRLRQKRKKMDLIKKFLAVRCTKWRGVSVVLVSHLPQRRHTQDQLTHGSMRTAMARYATRIRRVKRWLVRW